MKHRLIFLSLVLGLCSAPFFANAALSITLDGETGSASLPGTLTLPANGSHTICWTDLTPGNYQVGIEYGQWSQPGDSHDAGGVRIANDCTTFSMAILTNVTVQNATTWRAFIGGQGYSGNFAPLTLSSAITITTPHQKEAMMTPFDLKGYYSTASSSLANNIRYEIVSVSSSTATSMKGFIFSSTSVLPATVNQDFLRTFSLPFGSYTVQAWLARYESSGGGACTFQNGVFTCPDLSVSWTDYESSSSVSFQVAPYVLSVSGVFFNVTTGQIEDCGVFSGTVDRFFCLAGNKIQEWGILLFVPQTGLTSGLLPVYNQITQVFPFSWFFQTYDILKTQVLTATGTPSVVFTAGALGPFTLDMGAVTAFAGAPLLAQIRLLGNYVLWLLFAFYIFTFIKRLL